MGPLPKTSPRSCPCPRQHPTPNASLHPDQTLLVTGLSPMADGWLAASAITLGLFLFSLGRAGIAVAQHSMLARTFTTNLAFAFSVVVACTQLISGVSC